MMRPVRNLKIAAAFFVTVALAFPVSAETMMHWAILRDDEGEVLTTIEEGEEVEVLGVNEEDPSRTDVYYPLEDLYGSVSTGYVYGGTEEESDDPQSYGKPREEEDEDLEEEDEDDEERQREDNEEDDDLEAVDEDVPFDPSIWIDVDIDAQVLTLYQGDEAILCADCTTGTYGVNDTPTGEFTILNKTVDTNLVGTRNSGETYSRGVCYWMSLTDWGIGIHDAPWKNGVLGGDVYMTDGSQGCINLDVDVAAAVYSYVSEGTRVVIH